MSNFTYLSLGAKMPLDTLDGKRISRVAHARTFDAVVNQLGTSRVAEGRAELTRLVDEMEPAKHTGLRTFSSSYLGSELTPWQHPLSHLYDVASEIEGNNAPDERIEEQAALIFGQFVWE